MNSKLQPFKNPGSILFRGNSNVSNYKVIKWGRYHEELSSHLITLNSKVFPVKNSNLQSSKLSNFEVFCLHIYNFECLSIFCIHKG